MPKKPSYEELEARINELEQMEQSLKQGERLNELLLDSLPHPAMLIKKDQTILAANRIAREVGAKIGGKCWRDFGQSEYIPEEDKQYINQHKGSIPPDGTRCTFCLSADALINNEPTLQPEVNAFGEYWDTWWVPIDGNTYLHYAINISEQKKTREEREVLIDKLRKALAEVKQLSGLLPICASCKKIRDDTGYWNQIESYIEKHTEAEFSHGICPDCAKEIYPDLKQPE